MSEVKIMLGNEAIARGAFEAGVKVSAAYPGTPSTEISENIVKYPEIYAEWSPNEKVAMEVAIGASISGVRAMASMKHVGVNVASDPLYTISYSGVNGGLVLVAADDPGLYSSQNEQDTRCVARAAMVPVLEPSDSQEAKDFMKYAFDLSEKYDTPIILRTTTRLSHSQGPVTLEERCEPVDAVYERNPAKYVMMPGNAKLRHVYVEKRMAEMAQWAESCEIKKTEYYNKKRGFICAGTTYNYAREAFGEDASYLKLGMVNPLPIEIIKEFAKNIHAVFPEIEEVWCVARRLERLEALKSEVTDVKIVPVPADITNAGDTKAGFDRGKSENAEITLIKPLFCLLIILFKYLSLFIIYIPP